MSSKRFYSNSYRCPDTPFWIMDKETGDRVISFKHEELPNGVYSLQKVVDFLNYLNTDIILLKEESNDKEKYEELICIKEKYNKKIADLKHIIWELEKKFELLEEEMNELTKENEGLIRLYDYYYNEYYKLLE